MHRNYSEQSSTRSTSRVRPFICVSVFALVLGFLASSNVLMTRAARAQEARPRRTAAASGKQSDGQTQNSRATASPTPSSGNTQRTTSTQTPAPKPTPVDRIAPQLGEPPPAPVLRAKPSPTPEEGTEVEPGDVVKINTDLVSLHIRVIDRNNRPINNVRQEELHVFEDGVPQPIQSFSREEVPISYGLAVDTSGSLRSQLLSVIDAAKTIINSNKSSDETFLVRFISSDKIETVQDFTNNHDLLMDGLDSLYVEGGQTAIIDAVYLTAEHVSDYKKGDESDRRRRALIVITDGEDRNSFYKQDQLFSKLREEDVQIFVIGFVNELDKEGGLIRKSPKDRAVTLITRLATETGGRAFFPQSLSELPDIANQIVRDLRTQYVVDYNPTNKTRDGSYRAIKVTVDQGTSSDKRIALTRSGRIAGREGGAVPKPPAVKIAPPKTSAGIKP